MKKYMALLLCLALLALATVMGWQLYGLRCADYLWGPRGARVYQLVYAAVTLLGATMDISVVWSLADVCNGLMCLPNLAALLALRRELENLPAKRGNSCLDFPNGSSL